MTFKVVFAVDAERDFELILDFLVESYVGFGDSPDAAFDRARERLRSIRADIEKLAKAPLRGTLHDRLLPGLRHVTLGRAVAWFKVEPEIEEVRVLAVFFGGQDHHRRMLIRLLS